MNESLPRSFFQPADLDQDGRNSADPFMYYSDGTALLSGEGAYIADIRLSGMLEAVFVRSPIARGAIKSVNVAAAQALPGVAHVATGADILRSVSKTLPWASMVLHASEHAPEQFNASCLSSPADGLREL